jgi:hypothetical protein
MIRVTFALQHDAFIFDTNIGGNFLNSFNHCLSQAFTPIRRHKIRVQLNREYAMSALPVLGCHLFN